MEDKMPITYANMNNINLAYKFWKTKSTRTAARLRFSSHLNSNYKASAPSISS